MGNKIRTKLKVLGSADRHNFQATFTRAGFKNDYHSIYAPTILLTNVFCNGKLLTEHLWMNYSKRFSDLGELNKGDLISFDGRVRSYSKGSRFISIKDYGISFPSNVLLVNNSSVKERPKMPNINNDKDALVGYAMFTNKDYYLEEGKPYESFYVHHYEDWIKENR